MITLTIDPSKFRDAKGAYLEIQAKRGVAQFVKKLFRRGLIETKEFFYAIEFHKNGWCHWHLAVRGCDVVPSHLNGVNMFLGQGYELPELWKYGMVNVSAPPEGDYYSPEHAMNYLTKYVAKQDVGPPDWILDSDLRFRKFSTSHGLGGKTKPRKDSIEKREPYVRRTPRERAEACAKKSRVLEVMRWKRQLADGEFVELGRKYRFLFDLDEDFKKLRENHENANTASGQMYWLKVQKILYDRDWDSQIDIHDRVNLDDFADPQYDKLARKSDQDREHGAGCRGSKLG